MSYCVFFPELRSYSFEKQIIMVSNMPTMISLIQNSAKHFLHSLKSLQHCLSPIFTNTNITAYDKFYFKN